MTKQIETPFVTAYGKKIKYRYKSNAPTLTEQAHKDSTDINKIIEKYKRTGVMEHIARTQPKYDVATPYDYHEAMNVIANANSEFEKIPAKIRAMFNNNPMDFFEFVQDEKNIEKMQDLGLAYKPTEAMQPKAASKQGGHVEQSETEKTTPAEGE